MSNMIETRDLTKAYGDFVAVSRLNLHVKRGSVYGFLGPNGAGKSTTMKMFLGLTAPSGGTFTIGGKSFLANRKELLEVSAPSSSPLPFTATSQVKRTWTSSAEFWDCRLPPWIRPWKRWALPNTGRN